jgi:nitronate monooxygenase
MKYLPLLKKLKLKVPIIQAPMAGGITTPELVAAVTNKGGLGSFAGGYLTPQKLLNGIREIRNLTDKPFSVNLFVPQPINIDKTKIKKMNAILNQYRIELGLPETDIHFSPDAFDEKIDVIIKEKIPVFSFTFGIPSVSILQKLKSNQILMIGTATTVREGIALEKAGVDAVVGQGYEAGGHRGTFLNSFDSSKIGTMSLIPQLVSNIQIPVIASGGIMDGRGMIAALALGAKAVQLGTAFLTCSESGINEAYRKAIFECNEENTTITSTFSGKPARGINNRFIKEIEKYLDIMPDYPIQNNLTQNIRTQAAKLNKAEFLSLWSGQGTRLSRKLSASQLIDEILKESKQTLILLQNQKIFIQ